jgi:hypothetical protein
MHNDRKIHCAGVVRVVRVVRASSARRGARGGCPARGRRLGVNESPSAASGRRRRVVSGSGSIAFGLGLGTREAARRRYERLVGRITPSADKGAGSEPAAE